MPCGAFRRLELCEAEAPADAIFLDRQAPGNHAFDLSKQIFHLETSWDLKPEIPLYKSDIHRYPLNYGMITHNNPIYDHL